jgi:hypothetical protein
MLTLTEIETILIEHYTPGELCDLLELSSEDIVDQFSFRVAERHDEILETIKGDLGYDTEDT